MSDIKLTLNKETGTGDLTIIDGSLELTESVVTAVEQRLWIKLRTFQGEWFLDADFGIPYFQLILVKGVTQTVVDNIIRQEILDTKGVASITAYESALDPVTREYSAQFIVRENEGAQLTVTI